MSHCKCGYPFSLGEEICPDCLRPNLDFEKVDHPQHYNKGIECWDYTTSHRMGFLEGNVIKYVTRYQHKNGLEDLLKAQAYLNKLIDVVKEMWHVSVYGSNCR